MIKEMPVTNSHEENGQNEENVKQRNFSQIDYEAFAQELNDLKTQLNSRLGKEDILHLKKIERWGRFCTFAGYATSWIFPNPFSAFLISQGNFTRWTMITHHVSHRGYDRTPGVPKRYTSKHYAVGKRRFLDWPDWIIPEAWNCEHNVFHHYHTGEIADPDLVEQNVQLLRNIKAPFVIKAAVILFFMCTWKLLYYAPNTLWIQQKLRQRQKKDKLCRIMEENHTLTYHGMKLLLPVTRESLEFWYRCVLPYGTYRFVLIPLLFLPLGYFAWLSVLITSIIAELITNIHTFIIIVPNHAGEDLYRFEKPITDQAEFYVRQVLGSVNYNCGKDSKDFLQGWLNYQIEHHLWPDMPMLKYREAQPRVKAICEKYNIPYVQESFFRRFIKLWKIMLGWDSMLVARTLSKSERKVPQVR